MCVIHTHEFCCFPYFVDLLSHIYIISSYNILAEQKKRKKSCLRAKKKTFHLFYIRRAILTQKNAKKGLIEKKKPHKTSQK